MLCSCCVCVCVCLRAWVKCAPAQMSQMMSDVLFLRRIKISSPKYQRARETKQSIVCVRASSGCKAVKRAKETQAPSSARAARCAPGVGGGGSPVHEGRGRDRRAEGRPAKLAATHAYAGRAIHSQAPMVASREHHWRPPLICVITPTLPLIVTVTVDQEEYSKEHRLRVREAASDPRTYSCRPPSTPGNPRGRT